MMAEGPIQPPSLDDLHEEIRALETLIAAWPIEQSERALALKEATEALNAEAFRRLIRALKEVPAMSEALRDAAGDEVIYAVLRRHGILKPSLQERIEDALDTIRPALADHGGNVEVVSIEPPALSVRFLGACDNCPASTLTFYSGVKKAVQEHVPEITEIKQVGGASDMNQNTVERHDTSPFADYRSDAWTQLMKVGDLAEGGVQFLDVEGRSVLLSRFGDKVSCFENACAHMGMSLEGGEIVDGTITCPHHEFQYVLETGACLTAPDVYLKPHAARINGKTIEVRLVN